MINATGGSSREDLNRSETFAPKNATPTAWDDSSGRGFVASQGRGGSLTWESGF